MTQHGPSRNDRDCQHSAQRPWGSVTGARHDAQSGGNRRSSAPWPKRRAVLTNSVGTGERNAAKRRVLHEMKFSAPALNLAQGYDDWRERMAVPRIFDRKAYAVRRARAGTSFLAKDVGENLALRIGAVNRQFSHGLDLNSRNEVFAPIAPLAERWTRTRLVKGGNDCIVADEEALPFAPESFDLVVSALSLHAVNDLPGALAQIRRVLKPDGLFLAALFGGSTLNELRAAFAAAESEVLGGIGPHIAPFADVRELGGLLQRSGLALSVADAEKTVVHYRVFSTLIEDLRALGETNVLAERARHFLRRDVLGAVITHYAENNADENGRLTVTFEVIYLTAWAPHESQQKPLMPGSAKMRLAEALGTIERSAGERAFPKPKDA